MQTSFQSFRRHLQAKVEWQHQKRKKNQLRLNPIISIQSYLPDVLGIHEFHIESVALLHQAS